MTADPTSPNPSAGHDHPRDLALDESVEWDERYGNAPIWSGDPNGALVTEVAHLPPGRVVDVGCGEGADAVWLAGQGWDVTGLDVSQVALDRAAEHAVEAGVTVTWLHSGLLDARLSAGSFDLVSALYPALRRTPGQDVERALLAAVAPGGVLLVVHHKVDPQQHDHPPFDPDDFVFPSQVGAALDDAWEVEVDQIRAREVPRGGAGAHHVDDIVLRARRLR